MVKKRVKAHWKKYNNKQKVFLIFTIWWMFGIPVSISEKHMAACFISIFFTITFYCLFRKSSLNKDFVSDTTNNNNIISKDNTEFFDYAVNINDVLDANENNKNANPHNTIKKETFKIAGVTHYRNNIMSLMTPNPLYDYSKRELIEIDCFERLYEYESNIEKVELVPEPDNAYDSNAVKVIFDNTHIGYIKRGSCSHVKNLLKSGKICRIEGYLSGGKYKELFEDEDYYFEDEDNEKTMYTLDRGKIEYFARVIIYTKQ